ncbi:MAG: hypothetical protein JWQ28_687 [Pedobacter sp.]|jgi:hypothetical protein|nr:hypothetical protein [Pedobacter sp.]
MIALRNILKEYTGAAHQDTWDFSTFYFSELGVIITEHGKLIKSRLLVKRLFDVL